MLIELGNPAPVDQKIDAEGNTTPVPASIKGPAVTLCNLRYGKEHFQSGDHGNLFGSDKPDTPVMPADELRLHLAEAITTGDGVTHAPGMEAILNFLHPLEGIIKKQFYGKAKPTWVWCDEHQEIGQYLAAYLGVPFGRPADVELTHHTISGPPGVGPQLPDGVVHDPAANVEVAPDPNGGAEMNITKNGRNIQARAFGGPAIPAPVKTTTTPTSTGCTLTGITAPGSTTAYNGMRVYASKTAAAAWMLVKSNTNASPPVLTGDRWYNPATPGGAAATTPANTSVLVLVPGAGPAEFMGLTASTHTPGTPSTTVTLPTEITTATGGLVRKIATTWAHTAGTNTTTLTFVFTANSHDTLPVTIAQIGTFQSMVHSNTTTTLFFATKFGTTATLSATGDALTVTQTITGT